MIRHSCDYLYNRNASKFQSIDCVLDDSFLVLISSNIDLDYWDLLQLSLQLHYILAD